MTINRKIVMTWLVYMSLTQSSFVLLADDPNVCDRGRAMERKYLFYDVNPGEGFNLRRDVYMRLAVLAKHLQHFGDFVLVLPPWGPLPHWRSKDIDHQYQLPWKKFFDVSSLKKYVPVMELSDVLPEGKSLLLDHVIILQHFKDAWVDGKWEEKVEYEPCHHKSPYSKLESGLFFGWFWNHDNIRARNVSCVSFQGHAKKLKSLITSLPGRMIMIDRAEIPLHDEYGNSEYWKVRRSMRFSSRLYSLAKEFRNEHLKSSDELDSTVLPEDWMDESVTKSPAKGGDYLCGHLRRQDFVHGRPTEVPSLEEAAKQLKKAAKSLSLKSIFIASDGTEKEMERLRSYLEPELRLVLYRPTVEIRKEILDGGVAIVEQIVCSRARHFIGSFESTFSFRIQEEREILHFPPESTFNRFCGDGQSSCEQPAKWRIVY